MVDVVMCKVGQFSKELSKGSMGKMGKQGTHVDMEEYSDMSQRSLGGL